MSFINALVPFVTKQITKFEAWDYASTMIKHQVWRIYLAKIMNVVIFAIINVELASGSAFFRTTGLITFNDGNNTFECREDEAAINMFKLVIVQQYHFNSCSLSW